MAFHKGFCLWILFLTMMAPVSWGSEREAYQKGANPNVYDGYHQVTGHCDFEFPRDHGAHPGYRTEWWYYTGHLHSESGKPYGFQLTFFRFQISPPGSKEGWPERPSAWRTQAIFLAHAA
ncbi:MAG: hypothetical protein JRL30_28645, partial [Deltaproteobacteria bacterium]|nr:hypothetical protein [Deltaproteobacteria bacterium]